MQIQLQAFSHRFVAARGRQRALTREGSGLDATRKTAIISFESCLARRGPWFSNAYLLANARRLDERCVRLGKLAALSPLARVLSRFDGELGPRAVCKAYRGMSEDRLAILGEEYCGSVLGRRLTGAAAELVRRARGEGHQVVLISSLLAHVMTPAVKQLVGEPVDLVLCNSLEIDGSGCCTGRLRRSRPAGPRRCFSPTCRTRSARP